VNLQKTPSEISVVGAIREAETVSSPTLTDTSRNHPWYVGRVTRLRLHTWLFGFLFLCFGFFLPRSGDWNEASRFDQALGIVEHHTLAIDQYHWNDGWDELYSRGHWYPNKAPGQTFLAAPVAAGYVGFLNLAGHGDTVATMGAGRHFKRRYTPFWIGLALASFITVSIPAALFFLLFFWFLGFFTDSKGIRLTLTLATALATNVFTYAQVLYPHVPVTCLLFTAFALLYTLGLSDAALQERGKWIAVHRGWCAALAGAALGGVVALDHTAIVPEIAVIVYGVTRVPLKNLAWLVAGGFPFVLFIAWYDLDVYGKVTTTGYNFSFTIPKAAASYWPHAGKASLGLGNPVWGMTLSPYRGIFFLSPFLLLAVPGIWLWRKRERFAWLFCLAIAVPYFVFVCRVPFWNGGSAVGPRYLVTVVPFIALPVVFVIDAFRSRPAKAAFGALITVSAISVWLETGATKVFPRDMITNPLFQYSLHNLALGRQPALNWGAVFLGPLVGVRSPLTLLWLPITLLIWTAFCTRRRRVKVRSIPPGMEQRAAH
jgi:hypothetical protein